MKSVQKIDRTSRNMVRNARSDDEPQAQPSRKSSVALKLKRLQSWKFVTNLIVIFTCCAVLSNRIYECVAR